jgi:hypothetical protein
MAVGNQKKLTNKELTKRAKSKLTSDQDNSIDCGTNKYYVASLGIINY